MPAPGDSIFPHFPVEARMPVATQPQDAMLSRMRAATPGGTMWADRPHVPRWLEAEPPPALLAPMEARLGSVENTAPSLVGLIKPAAPGAVLDALTDEITDRITWTLLPFTNIVAAGSVTPEHQWRAAEHFRPFFAIGALRDVVEQIVRERVTEAVRVFTRHHEQKKEDTHDGTR
jgi:hypothetical protein